MYYTSTQSDGTPMQSNRTRLEKHLPLAVAAFYLLSGDYASLVRHLRILV